MPSLYVPLRCTNATDVDGHPRGLNRDTQAIIDAYPRSANSFATVAFQTCQTEPVSLAHHFHAAATLLYGAKHQIPTLTIIRNPDDACVSHALMTSGRSLGAAFREYVAFHSAIQSVAGQIVVARFESVIVDFGKVTAVLNERYQTNFTEFDHTDDAVREVQAILDARMVRRFGVDGAGRGRGATPSEDRNALKSKLRESLESPSIKAIRDRALELFEHFHSNADI